MRLFLSFPLYSNQEYCERLCFSICFCAGQYGSIQTHADPLRPLQVSEDYKVREVEEEEEEEEEEEVWLTRVSGPIRSCSVLTYLTISG